jgi:signal transduction histidine kinase
MKRIALILQLLSFCLIASTQIPVVRFHHLTPEDELSQGHILYRLQDKGYIWKGIYYGLNRYNSYSKLKGDATSVISDVIYSLYKDKEGYIWVGTVSGLDRFDKKTETFEHFSTYKPYGINDGYIRPITQDNKGIILVATNNDGLYRIEAYTGNVTYYMTSCKIGTNLLSNTVTDLCIDKSNHLWIATEGGGLSILDLQSNNIKFIIPFANTSARWDKISCIFKDREQIHPPIIETWYFRFLIIMILGVMVFVYFRWRIARERKQNLVLAKMVKDRTQEITEKNNLLEEKAKELNITNSLLELRQKDIELQKEKLASQRDKLMESNATKDKLFSIIAHDLKNPFNVIIGFSDLIIENYKRYTDERRINMASQINQASRNAYQLLENLLEWSRSQKGSLIYNPVQAEISVLLKTAYNHVKEFAKNKEIQIEGINSNNKTKIFVDVNMMNTILRNLLNNAVKFSNVGSSINVSTKDFDDLYLVFSIKDCGIGMPEEISTNLFKLDQKVNQSGTAGEPGSGLGLLICKDFVEAHNGNIWVETKQGGGTTFYFTVPKAL